MRRLSLASGSIALLAEEWWLFCPFHPRILFLESFPQIVTMPMAISWTNWADSCRLPFEKAGHLNCPSLNRQLNQEARMPLSSLFCLLLLGWEEKKRYFYVIWGWVQGEIFGKYKCVSFIIYSLWYFMLELNHFTDTAYSRSILLLTICLHCSRNFS